MLTPVWVLGINDAEIPKIIEFGAKIKAKFGIQNFLSYKHGRNPTKQLSFDEFSKRMKALEKKHDVHLLSDFPYKTHIERINTLEKPFEKGDIVKANVVCDSRYRNEKLAVSKNRLILVKNCIKTGYVKVKILRSKHNLSTNFFADD